MSRTRCRHAVTIAFGAALLAVAWSLGVWLVVLTLCSAGAVLTRQRLLARRGLPVRLAAWAVYAPCGPRPPVALEHALAADLAAVSQGHLESLQRAQAVLAESVDDPWHRALGEERLAAAHDLVTTGALVGIRRRDSARGRLRGFGAPVALILLLAAGAMSQALWWLFPIGLVHALLSLECVALYERRRALPELLASLALPDPIRGLFIMREEDVARSLVALANRDPVVIHRARCLLASTGQQPHARRRLEAAERLLRLDGGTRPGATLAVWLATSALLVLGTTSRSWGGG